MGRLLRQGSEGQDVRAVQDVLNHHIRRSERLKVDGIFGPKTEARVREFQKANGLTVDGIVGPNTHAKLFEEAHVSITLLLLPRLQLTPSGSARRGLQQPRLIPPLRLPPLTPPLSAPFSLRLTPGSFTTLPTLGDPANVLTFTVRVPARNDPIDPHVRARQNIVELIDDLPVNSKFRAFLIDKVPNPVTRVTPPTPGFSWGLKPDFDPFDPTGFGVKGNAAFTVRLLGNGRPDAPNMVFGAWGDGKFFLNFTGQNGQARPTVEAGGTIILGAQGTF